MSDSFVQSAFVYLHIVLHASTLNRLRCQSEVSLAMFDFY